MEPEEKFLTASRKRLLASLVGYACVALAVFCADRFWVIPAYEAEDVTQSLLEARRTADMLLVTVFITLWTTLLVSLGNFKRKGYTTFVYLTLNGWFLIAIASWVFRGVHPYFNALYWLLALWMGLNFWGLMRSHR